MAEMKKLVVEGDVTMAFFAGENNSKRILLNRPTDDDMPMVGEVPQLPQETLGSRVSKDIDFPNDSEFDAFYEKVEKLRQQGLRTEDEVPDITRQVKMRITVEIL